MFSAQRRYRSAASASLLSKTYLLSSHTCSTRSIASLLGVRSAERSFRSPRNATCCITRSAHTASSSASKPHGEGRRHIRLSVVRPDLVGEWVPELNDSDVQEVSSNSPVRVWWRCADCDRNYMSSVYDRAVREKGCPFCSVDAEAAMNPFRSDASSTTVVKSEQEMSREDTSRSTGAEHPEKTIATKVAASATSIDGQSADAGSPLGRNISVIMDFDSSLAFRVSESAAGGTMEVSPLGSGKKVRATALTVDISSSAFQITGNYVDRVRLIRVETDAAAAANEPAKGASFAESYPHLLPYWNFTRNGAISPTLTPWDTMQNAWWVAHQSVFPMEEAHVIDFFSEVQPRLRSPLQFASAGSTTVRYFAVCEPLRRGGQAFHRAVYAFVRNPYSWGDQIRAQEVLEETLLSDIERAAHIKEAVESGQFDLDVLPTSVRDFIVRRLVAHNPANGGNPIDADKSPVHWNTHIPAKASVSSQYSVYTNENREFDNGMAKHVMPIAKLVEALNAQIHTNAGSAASLEDTDAARAVGGSDEVSVQDAHGTHFAPIPTLKGSDVSTAVDMWKSHYTIQFNEKQKEMEANNATPEEVRNEARSHAKQKAKRFQSAPFDRQLIIVKERSQAVRNGTLAAYLAFIAQRRAAAGKPFEGVHESPAVPLDDSEAASASTKKWLEPFALTLEDVTGVRHESPVSTFFDPAAATAQTESKADKVDETSGSAAQEKRCALPPRPEECDGGQNQAATSSADAASAGWSTDQFDYYLDSRNPQVLSDGYDGGDAAGGDGGHGSSAFTMNPGERIVTFVQDAREVDRKHSRMRRRPDRKAVEQAVFNTGVSNTFDDEKELDETLSAALMAKRRNRRFHGDEEDAAKVAQDEFSDSVADEVEQALQSDDRISLRRRKYDTNREQSGAPLPHEEMRNRQYRRRSPQPQVGTGEGGSTLGTVMQTGRERRFSLFRPRDEYYIKAAIPKNLAGEDGEVTKAELRAAAASQHKQRLSLSLKRATGIPSCERDARAANAEEEKQEEEPMVIPDSPRRVARPRRVKRAGEAESE